MQTLASLLLIVCPALLIIAALSDLMTMQIPNWISGLLILGFFPAAFVVGLTPTLMAIHFGIALAALVVGAGLFAMRVIGGGDAKLIAAACLWMGLSGSGAFVVWTGIVGGFFCLFLIMARKTFHPWFIGATGWLGRLMEPRGDIPYGVAIAVGALLAFPSSVLLTTPFGA